MNSSRATLGPQGSSAQRPRAVVRRMPQDTEHAVVRRVPQDTEHAGHWLGFGILLGSPGDLSFLGVSWNPSS